jgi:hypothetical protein
MDFIWDGQKAEINEAKHGVSFLEAREAFFDPLALIRRDDDHSWDEQRMKLIGATQSHLLVVVYVEVVEDLMRIISARPAERAEKKKYAKGE